MEAIDDKVLKGWEKVGDTILKHSERWSVGQKIVASLVCLLAGAALVSGKDNIKVAGGATIALFGVAFLTFRRRTIESEMLVLKDRNGKPRVSITADHGMIFFDKNLRPRMVVGLSDLGQPAIIMNDDREQIVVAVTEKGAAVTLGRTGESHSDVRIVRESLHLGSSPTTGLTLSGREDGASVTLKRAESQTGLHLNLSASSAVVTVGSPDGAALRLMAAPDGNLGIMFSQEKSHSAIFGGSGTSANLTFFDENGRQIVTYPDGRAIEEYVSTLAARV